MKTEKPIPIVASKDFIAGLNQLWAKIEDASKHRFIKSIAKSAKKNILAQNLHSLPK